LEKPELEAKPAEPEPTSPNLIDSLEFGLYEEKPAEVRHYNDYVNDTSLNMWCGFHMMSHLNLAIKKTFSNFYCGKVDPQFDIYDMDQNFLVFDSSDETKFSRHIIIQQLWYLQNQAYLQNKEQIAAGKANESLIVMEFSQFWLEKGFCQDLVVVIHCYDPAAVDNLKQILSTTLVKKVYQIMSTLLQVCFLLQQLLYSLISV